MSTVPDSAAAGPTPAPDRGALIAAGISATATWTLRLLLVAAGAVLIGLVLGAIWVVVLPVILALLLAAVLEPVSGWLIGHRVPRVLAAATVVVAGIALLVGIVVIVVESVIGQAEDIADQAAEGINSVRDWVAGPPLNIADAQIDEALDTAVTQLQDSASTIATGLFTGVSTVSSLLVTAVLAVILCFYFLKDGHRFLPWTERVAGRRAGGHLQALFGRGWWVLGGFIRTQALVSLADAVFIGLGLVVLGVPLALPLAVITFLLSFIPIAGAVIAGVLAVLIALVTNGFITALLVLGVVLVVQQLEGNVLQPVLQSRTLNLHPAVVLLAVTGGATLFGIVGAFLAVPVVAVLSEVLRYVSEQIDEQAPDRDLVTKPAQQEEAAQQEATQREAAQQDEAVDAADRPAKSD